MKKKSLLFIVLAGVLWGTSGIFVNVWSKMGLPPLQITAIRTMLSFPCFLIYTLCFNRGALSLRLRDIPLYIGSGITLFATAACYYSAMKQTSISTAVILMYTAPVLVLGWSVAFFGEKLTLKKGISVICVLIGCALYSFLFAAVISLIACDFPQIQSLLADNAVKAVPLVISHAVVTFVLPYFLYTISLKKSSCRRSLCNGNY